MGWDGQIALYSNKEKLLLLHWKANISKPSSSTASIWRKEGVACEDALSSMYHECGQKYSSKSDQLLVSLSPTTHSGTLNEWWAETILAEIGYAAALDLDRRPRLSRTNTGKFTMYPVCTKRVSRCLKYDISPLSCVICFPREHYGA